MGEEQAREATKVEFSEIREVDGSRIGRGNPASEEADVEGQQWVRWVDVRCPVCWAINRIPDGPSPFERWQCWNWNPGIHYFHY